MVAGVFHFSVTYQMKSHDKKKVFIKQVHCLSVVSLKIVDGVHVMADFWSVEFYKQTKILLFARPSDALKLNR